MTQHQRLLAVDDVDRLALDRASVRSYDKDGHLHVAVANISKAAVNPYLGHEIPGYQRLGLDPGRVYKLLRDPAELERAAPTFAGKPLLIKHTPLAADDHPHERVVGAVGPTKYAHPYLQASLHIWPGDAIDLVESGEQAGVSCGYRYDPDMTPGVYAGQRYDGVMRNLSGNHVALVKEGRAGPDCIIGDEAMKKETQRMSDMRAAGARFPASVIAAAKARLAEDASLADLAELLDAFSGGHEGGPPPEGFDPGLDPALAGLEQDAGEFGDPGGQGGFGAEGGAPPPMEGEPGPDQGGDPIEQIKAFLRSILTPEQMQQLDQMVAGLGAEGAPEGEPEGEPDDGGEGEPPDEPGEKADGGPAPKPAEKQGKDSRESIDMMSKPAMDAAIAAAERRAAASATAAVLRAQRELRAAENAVRPYVGDLALTYDSAEQVYRAALKMRGVKHADTIHASALPALLEALPSAAAAERAAAYTPLAQDAASNDDFAKRFPLAGRLSA